MKKFLNIAICSVSLMLLLSGCGGGTDGEDIGANAQVTPQQSAAPVQTVSPDALFDAQNVKVGDKVGDFTVAEVVMDEDGGAISSIVFTGEATLEGEYFIADGAEASDFGDVICVFAYDPSTKLPVPQGFEGEPSVTFTAEQGRQYFINKFGTAKVVITNYTFLLDGQISGATAEIKKVESQGKLEKSTIYPEYEE